MAVLEYLNENNEWKKVNAYGVSSVNGQQGDVKITPDNIGAPTRDRVERLNRELQERLKKVEWKDITEDVNNSDKSFNEFITSLEPGRYYYFDGDTDHTYYDISYPGIGAGDSLKTIKEDTFDYETGGEEFYKITRYQGNKAFVILEIYFNHQRDYPVTIESPIQFRNNVKIKTPTENFHPATKKYVDDAIANTLTTIDNAETLSF